MMQAITDTLFIALQRALPEKRLGRWVYALARSRRTGLRRFLIRSFMAIYRVDLDECERRDAGDYVSLNDFFTRALRAGARPLPADPSAVISPADGRIDHVGTADGDTLLQAKRFRYRIADLLAADEPTARAYTGGTTLTIYLAPHNYHRVHMPLAARIEEVVYVPGRRWAVNARTTRRIAGLYAANERVVVHCTHARGPFAIVLVGALNVASISLAFLGEIAPPPGHGLRRWRYAADAPDMAFDAGALLGQFNLGSTVVMVAAPGVLCWQAAAGRNVRMGEVIGTTRTAAAGP